MPISPNLISPIEDKHGGVCEPFDAYWARVRCHLPHCPREIAAQWLHEHPHAVGEWAWLGIETLRFTLAQMATAELVEAHCDDGTIDSYRETFEGEPDRVSPRFASIADFMRSNGVWPASPIFLDNTDGTAQAPNGWRCAFPLQLLEGYHRMAVLRSLAGTLAIQPVQAVWIARR